MLSEITAGRALLAVRSQICQGKAWSIQHPPVAVSERARCLGVPLSCGSGLISAAAGGAVSGPLAHRPPSHAPAGMVRAVGHGAVVEGHHRARREGACAEWCEVSAVAMQPWDCSGQRAGSFGAPWHPAGHPAPHPAHEAAPGHTVRGQ